MELAYNLTAETMMAGALKAQLRADAERLQRGRQLRRPVTPSFEYTFWRWLLTVRTDRNSRSAISLLDSPCAASVAMSRSRAVSGTTMTAAVRPGVRAPSQSSASAVARAPSAAAARRSPLSLERLRRLGGRLGGEQQGAEPFEAIGHLDERIRAGRRPTAAAWPA